MQYVLMILVAVLVFGSVIFIHELGHFAVAKWSGIRVNEFAIGMGPTLLKFGKGETTYALRLLPIGGFVSMEGEDEQSEDNRSYTKAPILNRILVIIAGAFMNIVLAFLALVVLVSAGGDITSHTISQVRYEQSGLQVGDELLKVNDRACFIMNDMSYEFARTQNGKLDLQVRRDGEKVQLRGVEFPVVQAVDKDTGEFIIDENTGEPYEYMDVGFSVLPIKRNVLTVVREAFFSTLSYGRMIYLSLLDLVTGRVELNQLSGPVGIVKEIGNAVEAGWRQVLQMLALISINLGIVNMLPLPALDGGKALLLVVEGIRRKPLKQKYEIAINMAGFAILMCVMLLVSVNDVRKLIM